MKLLIVTQKVDKNDPVLGFFHRWIEEFAKNADKVLVIALGVGEYSLPENVRVLSLGKESGASRLKYLWRFYNYIWRERKNYDSVFVHMNQEYVLLAGDIWRALGKRVYLWRNHAKGSLLTTIAVYLSNKVFYTSPQSFTARFDKSVRMPVGVDIVFFKPDESLERKPNSILFLGRISPVKRVLEFVQWFGDQDGGLTATIAGPVSDVDLSYKNQVESLVSRLGLESRIKILGSVSQEQAKRLYQENEFYVNLTPSGSFDKTILEAMACGAVPLVVNEAICDSFPKLVAEDVSKLSSSLAYAQSLSHEEKFALRLSLREYVIGCHELSKLIEQILG